MERLRQQMEFIVEVDKVKNIMRQTYLSDAGRKENDAEHSWHLALMAVLLKEYSNEEVDLSKVVPMVLIHNLVGSTQGILMLMMKWGRQLRQKEKQKPQTGFLAFCRKIKKNGSGNYGKNLRNIRLRKPGLPHVLDNCQPLLLNDASGGRSWAEHGVKKRSL